MIIINFVEICIIENSNIIIIAIIVADVIVDAKEPWSCLPSKDKYFLNIVLANSCPSSRTFLFPIGCCLYCLY